jgi:glycosyltransferase involved in cell wall biosynthesis
MPQDFAIVAIIAAYNEADIIGASVCNLIDQGISVFLLDDGSTDGTAGVVEPYVGRGVIGVERLRPAEASGSGEFALKAIVRRKAQLAIELDADWFINHDADEFRESPWGDVPLKEAIRRVDALGYNAIDFESFDFRPTDDRGHAGKDVRTAFQFYSEAAPYDRVQIRCWKKTPCVELESTGGHDTQFDGRRVFPVRFVLRHYPIRSQAHGERKVFAERKPRYAEQERALGWHVQYDDVVDGTSFIHNPDTLKRFDPVGIRIELSLRHRGVEELEQSLGEVRADASARSRDIERLQGELRVQSAEHLATREALRVESAERLATRAALEHRERELDEALSQLTARSHDLARMHKRVIVLDGELTGTRAQLAHRIDELAAHREEISGLRNALEHRQVEVANLQSAVADFMKQLEAFRHSFSWRWTAPLRAVYRLLTGR